MSSDDRGTPGPAREEVAIVGMAGRFPGAAGIDEFWRNLRDGVESIRQFSADELGSAGVDAESQRDPSFVNAGAVMDDPEGFDAPFFGMSAREAEITDPQHRVLLECAWEALEHAGHDPARFAGRIGVFGGVGPNTYFQHNVSGHRDLLDTLGNYPVMIASEREYAITRIAFKLNLGGPALSVNTACSTTGVALHLACQSVLSGECDLALVGGARIRVPLRAGYAYVEDGILSPDGHCRPFDEAARGTVIGNGAVMLVVRRLSDALRDGDTVYGVIKGTAVNNDGARRVGFTAPGVSGQAEVIAEALAVAEVDPATIGYVEAHGTGTAIGDPIEVAALTKAYRAHTERAGYCAIGSVKSNIGHLDAAAGAAGVVKAVLALQHGQIPPSLHYVSPNPQIDFSRTPFFVSDRLRKWEADGAPRRAAVSTFGLGGTNAHVVLEEAPPREEAPPGRSRELIVLSARTESALESASDRLAAHLERNPELSLSDTAYTLQVGRQVFPWRRALVAGDAADGAHALRTRDPRRLITREKSGEPPRVAFLFPGGGAQYVGMGGDLYAEEPIFREAFDRCAALARGFDIDLHSAVYPPDRDDPAAAERLEQPSLALPALFAVEYAMAELWRSWGIEPSALIGHSMGEYAAACLAGTLGVEDALALAAVRGRLFETLDAGSMLSVPLPEAEVRPLLRNGAAIAAINKPDLCVVSGTVEEIDDLETVLAERGIDTRRIHIAVAAHSPMVEPILDEFTELLRGIRFHRPGMRWISNVSGTWITDEEATDPAYWAGHLRQPVRFSEGLEQLLDDPELVLLEVGPGQTLSTFARMHPSRSAAQLVLSSIRHPKEPTRDDEFALTTVGRLWLAGASIDWTGIHRGQRRRRVPLPGYPFEHARYWLAPAGTDRPAHVPPAAGVTPAGAVTATRVGEPRSPAARIPTTPVAATRKDRILAELLSIVRELSGVDASALDVHASFLELGFDSLFLTQATTAFYKKLKVRVTFRQLFDEAPTLAALAEFIDRKLPPDSPVAAPPPPPVQEMPAAGAGALDALRRQLSEVQAMAAGNGSLEWLIRGQLEIMAQQLAALTGAPTAAPAIGAAASSLDSAGTRKDGAGRAITATATLGPWRPIDKGVHQGGLTEQQERHLRELIERFTARTGGSKRLTQQHRGHLADPRTAAGFRQAWKDLVYPIVCTRAKGCRLWDVDGNEWIDITMGFGVSLFGHAPDFVTEAIRAELDGNWAIGPQTTLAGEVAELVSELTGMDRVAFCNTGSEAVLAAIRTARTVTGRNLIAVFAGDYHGVFDEVLVKGVPADDGFRVVPVAPGIPPSASENVLVLDYGNDASLEVIRERADELAAVVVEPVQSRRPTLRPKEFVRKLRILTAELDVPLVFDEIITGFRVHPGGAQAWYGIEADIATYGKVIAGGMPIGIVAGKARFLDALDGGYWQYGDGSVPEVGVTWFAGTFVRHPLALAATKACLLHLKSRGPALQEGVNRQAERFAGTLNSHFEAEGLPIRIEQFSSMFLIVVGGVAEYASLYFHYLRDQGVHCHEGRPHFFTTAHTARDVEELIDRFELAADAMRAAGFFADADSVAQTAAQAVPAERVPLTAGQQEIWLACQVTPEASCAFNISTVVELEGPIDVAAMRGAIADVVARHEALRARFSADGAWQQIDSDASIDVPVHDLSGEADEERAVHLEHLLEAEATTPFDLEHGPVIRASVVRLDTATHRVLVTAHHIACDGWSMGILHRDLGSCYRARAEGATPALPEPPSFAEFVRGAVAGREAPDYQELRGYWLSQFEDGAPTLELPWDHPRPPRRSYHCGDARATVGPADLASLKRTAARLGCTPVGLFAAAYTLLLHRLSGHDDLVVGLAMAGQPAVAQPGLVGHCVNLLPIRVRVEGGPVTDHVTSAMHTLLDAFDHQGLTYGELLPHLTIERDASRLPLVSTILTYETATKGVAFGVEDVYIHGNRRQFCNFDLELYLTEADGALTLQLNYSADLLAPDTADRWLQMYRVILSAIAEDPTEAVATLPVMDEAERERVLVEWNRTEAPVPDTTLHQWFEAQVAGMPDAVALVCGTERLTYAALNARANRIARRLRNMGVSHGDLVGVCLERTPDLVAAVLGILKTGGAYVPLDPQYPADRVAFIAGDAKLGVIVAQGSVRSVLPPSAAAVLVLDADGAELASEAEENLEPHGAPDDLAYVIYTSGSTGRPKGVAIEHRSAVALLSWAHTVYGPEELAGVLASTSICFDLSVFELFVPLTGGGAVVLVHDALAFPAAPAAEEVTLVNTVPSAMEGLLGSGEGLPPGVQTVNLAGEKLTVELVREIYARTKARRVYDLYGPSEDTTYSTYALRTADGPYTIGRPIANTRAYVLDGRGQPVPVGAIGELYLGGAGLARGYLGRPEQTAERFVPNPFGPAGSRIYRTGDLARYLPDGNLEFLGRLDHQVKLRGFRIELGEIETVLREHPTVEAAVALVREDQPGDRRLVAYVVPAAGAAVSDGEVLELLQRRVPQYMVPQHLIVLGELPLTPNGKLDRRALPVPDADGADRRDALVEPATPLERDLAAIWRELLRVSRVGRDDDFFAIGGHSLTATRLVARVRERLSVRLPLRAVFEHPTLRALAQWLESQAASVAADREREEVEL